MIIYSIVKKIKGDKEKKQLAQEGDHQQTDRDIYNTDKNNGGQQGQTVAGGDLGKSSAFAGNAGRISRQ